MDFYKILCIEYTATLKEIKKAYSDLSKKYHPDRNPGDDVAVKKFQEIQEAYEVLGDESKKIAYDSRIHIGKFTTSSNKTDDFIQSASRRYRASQSDLDSIQQQFFGGTDLQGRNILIHLLLNSHELDAGVSKVVRWKKNVKCKTCDGYGTAVLTNSEFVKCKACNGTGNMLKVPGKQGAMYPKCDFCDGSGSLDMYCKTCKGTGIFTEMVIEEMIVEVLPKTPSGHQIIMRGRGEPGQKGGISGNLHVVIIEQNQTLTNQACDNKLN